MGFLMGHSNQGFLIFIEVGSNSSQQVGSFLNAAVAV
jgi:hypothetical protein